MFVALGESTDFALPLNGCAKDERGRGQPVRGLSISFILILHSEFWERPLVLHPEHTHLGGEEGSN